MSLFLRYSSQLLDERQNSVDDGIAVALPVGDRGQLAPRRHWSSSLANGTARDDRMEPCWIKIGEATSRDTLKQTISKIRAKWLGRYDFLICRSNDESCFELRLRHR